MTSRARRALAFVLAAPAILGATACNESTITEKTTTVTEQAKQADVNSLPNYVKEIAGAAPTGDKKQDLELACEIGRRVYSLNNDQRALAQRGVVGVLQRFGDASKDKDFATVSNAIRDLFSLDAKVRENGERTLAKSCDLLAGASR